MTTIWNATATGQARKTARIPLALSGTSGPSYITTQDIIDITNPAGKLRKYREAEARRKIGLKRPLIIALGDSTTLGIGGTGTTVGDQIANNYPTRLRNMFLADGIDCQSNSFFNQGSSAFEKRTSGCDARVTFTGGSWTSAADTGIGGSILRNPSGGAGVLTFAPGVPVDTFKIWYVRKSANGSLLTNIDGGANTTTNTAGADALLGPITMTTTLGTHALNIASTGGEVFVYAVEAYNSTKYEVSIMNGAWSGATSSNMAENANPWSNRNALAVFNPDLILMAIGINDWAGSVPVATYKSNIDALVVAALATTASFAFVTPAPSGVGISANQAAYIAAMYEVALTRNVPVIDNHARFQSYEISSNLYNDPYHPNNVGYVDFAQGVYNVIGKL